MDAPRDNYELARDLADKGYIPVAMRPGAKLPAERAWQEWAGRPVTDESIARRWRGTRLGVAILCAGLVVLDVDDPAILDDVLRDCGLSAAPICRTPRGGYHVHALARSEEGLRRRIKVNGRGVDLLTGPSLSILPPHTDDRGVPYEWLTGGLPAKRELPVADVGWTRERTPREARPPVTGEDAGPATKGDIRFPERYCLAITSVQGSNGSRGLVRMVCVMRDAGRTPEQTLSYALGPWNAACAAPQWPEEDIRHAIRRHYGIASF